jgi:hypothetical protein
VFLLFNTFLSLELGLELGYKMRKVQNENSKFLRTFVKPIFFFFPYLKGPQGGKWTWLEKCTSLYLLEKQLKYILQDFLKI